MRIAVCYALLGVAWIFLSGWLLHFLIHDPEILVLGENVKGWFFIGVTSLLLWIALDRYFGRARRSVERLKESEARLRLVGDNLPESYVFQYTQDPVGVPRFHYMSAGAERVHGIPVAHILNDDGRLWEQIDPEQRTAFVKATEESVRNRAAFGMELRVTRPGGDKRIILIRSMPRHNEAGKVLWDGFGMDITEQKQALQSLQRSETEYKHLFENSMMGIAEALPDGHIIRANMAYANMYGYAGPDEMIKEITDIGQQLYANAEDRNDILKILAEKGHLEPREVEVVRRDGSHFHVLIAAQEVRDASGRLTHYQATHVDITERKNVAEALRQSEEKHRRLFETMAQGVVYQAADGAVISANPAAERILGLSWDQMKGKTSMDRAWRAVREDGSDLSGADHPAMAALRNGKTVGPFVMGVHNPVKNAYAWLSVTAIPLFQPDREEPFQVYATFDDITEKRNAEREYQILFREMLEGFALHEIICDAEGVPVDYRFLTVNPAFERMTGLRSEDIVGRTVLDVLPGTERHWIDTYGRVALTGEPVVFENYTKTINKHFEITAFRPAHKQFACIFSDITERKLAEEERVKLEEQLRQAVKMEAIGNLAGGIAHDFNNMLGVILGYTEMMKSELPGDNTLRGRIGEIEKAAVRSRDITRQLLAFSRRQIVAPKIVDFNLMIGDLQKTITRLIGEDIYVELYLQEDLWKVKIDPAQIDQILVNLVVNARDAMPRGGKLTIETTNKTIDEDYQEKHYECYPGSYVLLAISDNGVGMDRETQDRIFDPFFTTKEAGRGTGLGLSTVYGIVKQNNGFINVYSECGQGTTFKIYLPGIMEAAAEVNVYEAPAVSPSMGTVLLVEDDDMLRQMTKAMLERIGHKVLTAEGGEDAISSVKNMDFTIDLVLTDVVMPGMSGKELREKLEVIRPGIKVLFMSGYTSNVIAHHGILDEGVHFIQKPFRMGDLAGKIGEVMGIV